MDAKDFAAILKAEGFAEAISRSLPAGQATPVHSHEFDAKVLVTAGEFTMERDGIATTHRPGDMFNVPMGHPHAERTGPDGAEYLSGRRAPAA